MLRPDSQQAQHLAKSILLEESGNPVITRAIVWFSFLMIVAFGAWAALTPVDEVANAQGEIIPAGQIKQVQHLEGGTISAILVSDGTLVEAGQPVLRLETRVFESEIKELEIQRSGLERQRSLLAEEIDLRRDLFEKGLSSKTQMLALQRSMEGIENSIIRIEEQLTRHQFSIENSEVRATESGLVHGLKEHTIGGVVAPGSTILEIVPQQKQLIAEIQIKPAHIGHVKVGQSVKLKFDSYDFSRYGALEGRLDSTSATTFIGADGKPYYRGRVLAGEGYLQAGETKLPIFPGMTLTASIKTGQKTVLEYILKPIYASSQQALRER